MGNKRAFKNVFEKITGPLGRGKFRITTGVLAVTACVALGLACCTFSVTSGGCVVALAIAGVCLLVIDVMMQRLIVEKAWCRRLLPIWCVVPFVLVYVGGALQHRNTRSEAMLEIERMARQVDDALREAMEAPPGPPPSNVAATAVTEVIAVTLDRVTRTLCIVTLAAMTPSADSWTTSVCRTVVPAHYPPGVITAAIDKLTTDTFGTKHDDDTVARFRRLATTLANDISSRSLTPARVRELATRDTTAEFALALIVQLLFVLWIPALLAVAVAKARTAVDAQGPRAFTPNGVQRSMKSRDKRILGENRPLLIPRLCFAMLLFLGTNYVFAPLGLRTTYMMTLVDQHSAAGQTSFTLWTTSFGQAPVVVAGFVGFLLYAVITATQRFAQDDFDDDAMFSLLVRGLVVGLLSFALSSFPSTEVSRIFVFVAGVFPVRALEALAQKANISLDPDLKTGESGSFDGLPSLDPAKAFALRAAGIRSTADLAAMEINSVAERVRINPFLLGRTVDRAILIDAVGKDIADQLEKHGIRLATDLASLRGRIPVSFEPGFAETAGLAAERLAADTRVSAVREWLANRSHDDVLSETRRKVEFGEWVYRLVERHAPRSADSRFVTIDLRDFEISQQKKLLYRDFSTTEKLIDAVYSMLPPNQIERYQYGKQWELRLDPDAPGTALQHARFRRLLYGVPLQDCTPMAEDLIKPGNIWYAVKLPREMASQAANASPGVLARDAAPTPAEVGQLDVGPPLPPATGSVVEDAEKRVS